MIDQLTKAAVVTLTWRSLLDVTQVTFISMVPPFAVPRFCDEEELPFLAMTDRKAVAAPR
jgi:peroxiredoxin